jgi:hypothetical protein
VGVDDRLLVGGEKPGAPQDVPVDLLTHVTAQLRGEAPSMTTISGSLAGVVSLCGVFPVELPTPGGAIWKKSDFSIFVRLN